MPHTNFMGYKNRAYKEAGKMRGMLRDFEIRGTPQGLFEATRSYLAM